VTDAALNAGAAPIGTPVHLAPPAPVGTVPPTTRQVVGLGAFFGTLYFVQGVGEPTEGLIAQPVRSLLKGWGLDTAEIAAFAAIMAFPWTIKPLYGVLTDFVPLLGYRRKSWLILATLLTIVGLLAVWALDLPRGATTLLLCLLLLPTIGVAFTDVVADALMIEKGQPLGLTGRLQSIQWGALYSAGLITGVLGGWLSQTNHESWGFLICGSLTVVTLLCAIFLVDEERGTKVDRGGAKAALVALWKAARSPLVLSVGGYLFLWNWNPFSAAVLYTHFTEVLKLGGDESELFYGKTVSVIAVGSIAACVIYAFVCRALSPKVMVHGSIALGVGATLLYWGVRGETSAFALSLAVGVVYMLSTLVQLDLAARACPAESAGTTFALLMSLCNLSVSLSQAVGGSWYEHLKARGYTGQQSFDVLVGVGALFTASCWLLLWLVPAASKALLTAAEPPKEEGKPAA
jgi:MFS family permease